jgi:hypothetical protein
MMSNYMKLIVNDSNIGLMIKLKWYVYVFIYVRVYLCSFSTSANFVYFSISVEGPCELMTLGSPHVHRSIDHRLTD